MSRKHHRSWSINIWSPPILYLLSLCCNFCKCMCGHWWTGFCFNRIWILRIDLSLDAWINCQIWIPSVILNIQTVILKWGKQAFESFPFCFCFFQLDKNSPKSWLQSHFCPDHNLCYVLDFMHLVLMSLTNWSQQQVIHSWTINQVVEPEDHKSIRNGVKWTSIFWLLLHISFIEAGTCGMGFNTLDFICFWILINRMCGTMLSGLEMLSLFKPGDVQL